MELSMKDLDCRLKTQETLAESIKRSHDLEASSFAQINEDNFAQISRLEVEANAMRQQDKEKADELAEVESKLNALQNELRDLQAQPS